MSSPTGSSGRLKGRQGRPSRREVIHVPAERRSALWVSDVELAAAQAAAHAAAGGYPVRPNGENADGPIAFVEVWVPAGSGPPMHVHPGTEEAYQVLSGELDVLDGERTFRVRPGDFVLVPPGVPHAYRIVGTAPARMLFLLRPPAAPDGLRVDSPAPDGDTVSHHAFT